MCLSAPPEFDGTVAAFRYAEPVSWMIQRFKFNQKLSYGRVLGEALAAAVLRRHEADMPQAIIPVPLHGRRQRERGFNQSLEIARIVATELALPLAGDAVARVRATEEQSLLDADARCKNIRGAFAVKRLPWRRVAIVDDVMTTGNTVGELAKTLKHAGCENVQVWVVARANR